MMLSIKRNIHHKTKLKNKKFIVKGVIIMESTDMNNYVTREQCESHREELEKKILDVSMKVVELETTLKSLVSTNKLILGSLITGMVTIVITLLTRGI